MNYSLPSTLAFPGGMVPRIISGTLNEHIVILLGANIVFLAKYAGADETSDLGTALVDPVLSGEVLRAH
jgi:hypothetical protein